jgi:hypothetical protein
MAPIVAAFKSNREAEAPISRKIPRNSGRAAEKIYAGMRQIAKPLAIWRNLGKNPPS